MAKAKTAKLTLVKPAAEGSENKQAVKDKRRPKNVPPRKQVLRAQQRVLKRVMSILNGNCNAAVEGNHQCAKFVLDWSGISDIRTPLAKPLKKKSPTAALLKRLALASAPPSEEGQPE
jgi:hypothetical protein